MRQLHSSQPREAARHSLLCDCQPQADGLRMYKGLIAKCTTALESIAGVAAAVDRVKQTLDEFRHQR